MSQVGEAFVRLRPDASTFRRETTREVERSVRQSERELARFSRGALVGTGALRELGRAAAFASLSFIGGAGLVVGIRSTIRAAAESETAAAQLTNALSRQGLATAENRRAIEERTRALSEMAGFDDELLSQTFVRLVNVTGDVNKALRDNAIAADIARQRGISLESAAQLVIKAELGQAGALRRVGIAARQGASSVELLDLLQRKFAGSAEAYGQTAAGAQARFQVALENTQELIGTALLPALTRLLNRASEWLNEQENQKRIQDLVTSSVEAGTDAARFLERSYNGLRDATNFLRGSDPFGGKSLLDFARAVPFAESNLDSFVESFEELFAIQRRVAEGYRGIEEARIQAFQPGGVVPEDVSGTAIAGRPLTDQERLAIVLGLDPNNVTAIREEQARDQRAFDFAMKMIRERRGRTKFFAAEAERLAREIQQADARLQAIADQQRLEAERRREEARQRREEARRAEEQRLQEVEENVRFLIQDIDLGLNVAPLSIAQVNKAIEDRRRARIEALLGVPERLRLATQIQEQRTDEEETLVPFLQREVAAAQKRLRLLRGLGATRNEILQQQLTIASLNRRIRDILKKDRDDAFSVQDLFSEGARAFAELGSNIAPIGQPLSPQEAGGEVVRTAQERAKLPLLSGATIIQNFIGQREPAQALASASQAARALR